MKTNKLNTSLHLASSLRRSVAIALTCGLPLASLLAAPTPLGTSFTYSGRLKFNNQPANGSFDMQVILWDDPTAGSQVGNLNPNQLDAVSCVNGLFITNLDFGAVFSGNASWLEFWVRPTPQGNQNPPYTQLLPRQQLNPSPDSLFALSSATVASGGVNGLAIQNAAITAPKIATGQVVKSLNNLQDGVNLLGSQTVTITPNNNNNTITIDAVSGPAGWSLTGNASTTPGVNFLGTTDNQPLELQVYGKRALRFGYASGYNQLATVWPNSINVAGGFWDNLIDSGVVGGTIAGGGFYQGSVYNADGPHPNYVGANFGTVGGGYDNSAFDTATVPGGHGNKASGLASFAAGTYAGALHDGCFVWNDSTAQAPPQNVPDGYDNRTTAPDQFRVKATGGIFLSHGAAGVNIDQLNLNNGDVSSSLRFGGNSGEAIGSKRTFGGNQYGLDLYTRYTPRLSIDNNGNVGIGTTSPGAALHVQASGGVGVFVGDDGPFGVAAFESNLSTSWPFKTHAFFAEDGNAVFSVAAGGEGYFGGNVSVCSLTVRGGCDLAEPFQISGDQAAEGSVVIIDEESPGRLKLTSKPYDTRVAGIVSGANGVKPGIALQQEGKLDAGQNVALSGRVYVLADASNGSIKPGDLLTTSATPGHAMKVTDHAQAQGAVLGKAMSGLREGNGMVLVLVTLQ